MRNNQLSPTLWAAFVRTLAAQHGARGYAIRDMAERFQISIATSRIWMKALKDNDCIFIVKWEKHSRVWVPLYAWGFKEHDAPRPPYTLTPEQRKRKNEYQRKRSSKAAAETAHKNAGLIGFAASLRAPNA